MSPRCPPEPARSAPRSRKHNATHFHERKNHPFRGIIMNGVTGRMGLNQHLRRSIYAIMQQGGVKLSPSEVIMPKPLLVGRNSAKLEAISANAAAFPGPPISISALANPD